MTTAQGLFKVAVKEHLGPGLRDLGFKGSGQFSRPPHPPTRRPHPAAVDPARADPREVNDHVLPFCSQCNEHKRKGSLPNLR